MLTVTIARRLKQILGVVIILIGSVLLWNLMSTASVLIHNANTVHDIKGLLAIGACGLILLAGGAVLVWRPDWTNTKV